MSVQRPMRGVVGDKKKERPLDAVAPGCFVEPFNCPVGETVSGEEVFARVVGLDEFFVERPGVDGFPPGFWFSLSRRFTGIPEVDRSNSIALPSGPGATTPMRGWTSTLS